MHHDEWHASSGDGNPHGVAAGQLQARTGQAGSTMLAPPPRSIAGGSGVGPIRTFNRRADRDLYGFGANVAPLSLMRGNRHTVQVTCHL